MYSFALIPSTLIPPLVQHFAGAGLWKEFPAIVKTCKCKGPCLKDERELGKKESEAILRTSIMIALNWLHVH